MYQFGFESRKQAIDRLQELGLRVYCTDFFVPAELPDGWPEAGVGLSIPAEAARIDGCTVIVEICAHPVIARYQDELVRRLDAGAGP